MDRRRKSAKKVSVIDLKTEITKEKSMAFALGESCNNWIEIISECEKDVGVDDDVEPGGTWKTRYAYQFLHNRMLRQQVKAMRKELQILKHGQLPISTELDWDEMSPAECRRHIKAMHVEITSLKGYKKSIEEKLDTESFAYSTARDQCESILSDVWFQQESRIKDQEKQDRQILNTFKELRGKGKLEDGRIRLPTITPKPFSRQDSYKSAFDMLKAKKLKEKKKPKKKRSVTFNFDNT